MVPLSIPIGLPELRQMDRGHGDPSVLGCTVAVSKTCGRALETLSEPLEKLIAEDRLGEVKGIGDAIEEERRVVRNWPAEILRRP